MTYLITTAKGEVGPYSADQIAEFIAAGRLQGDSRIKDDVTGGFIAASAAAASVPATRKPGADRDPDDPYQPPDEKVPLRRGSAKETQKREAVYARARLGVLVSTLIFVASFSTGLIFVTYGRGVAVEVLVGLNLTFSVIYCLGMLAAWRAVASYRRVHKVWLLLLGGVMCLCNGLGFSANVYSVVMFFSRS